MKKVLSIVAAALLTLSLHAASWTFTNIKQSDFYPTGQGAVDGSYWTINGSSYQHKNLSTADELYVTVGQKFAPTEGLKFLTRGANFRVFFNGSGIRLNNPNATGVNPSIVIPNCKAGSDLKIETKKDGSNAGTMAVSNASVASLELDGTINYTATVLADGDVVINMSAGSGYIRSIEVVEHSVYKAQAIKEVVTLFEDEVAGVETTCTARRGAQKYTVDGVEYSNAQAWQLGTNNNLTFRVKNAKKVTFVGRAAKASDNRGFAVSLNGEAAENVMNTEAQEANVVKELILADGVNTISITGVGGAVYPLAFIVEKDAEEIATMSGATMSFTNKDLIIYSGNIALSTVTNSSTESEQGFAKASNILLYDAGLNPIQALRVCATSTVTIAAPSNYIIEKIGVRAAGASAARTIKINNAKSHEFAQVTSTTESEYFEWTLATPSNQLTLSTNGTMYFIITLFGYQTETFPVTLSHGYATFCAAEDVILPAELTAYVATGSTASEILLEEVAGGIVKANTGVVLMGEDGTYDLTITSGASALSSVLNGTVKRIANPGTVYCLNSSEGAFQQYDGAYIPANKAYFTAPAGAPARMAMRIGHVATDIDANANVNVNTNKVLRDGQILIVRGEKMYNLQGQLVK